jgi:hypothetical protein
MGQEAGVKSGWKYRLAAGIALASVVITATRIIRAEPPHAVGTWASLGTTPESRVGAAAVLLEDGRTLIVGGAVDSAASDTVVAFNPADGTFATVGQLQLPRAGHTATLLEDGTVLVTGGTTPGDLISADIEIFDPAAGTSVVVASMAQPRTGHAAAKLADGKVLIAGGTGTDGVLQTAEVFDPATGTTTATTLPMLSPRTGASATTLIDGRVLIAGGNNGTADLATAELFEPSSQIFEPTTTSLSIPRRNHAAVLLPNNNSVLIAGGSSNGVPQASSDLFVPAEFPDPYSYGMGSFAPTGSLITPRASAIASPHIEGYAVAMGGGAPEAEVYRFATIKTDKDDYAPGTKAVITGSGWEPNAEVTLVFQEDPAVHDDYILHVTADDEGNVYWDQWAPEEHDLNLRFYLMAKQTTASGDRRAQTTFTDSRTINFATLDGGTTVTVAPGATISAHVNVTTDNGGGGNQNWHSTGWRISTTAPGAVTCFNNTDHDGSGTYDETFSITAPATGGTFNAYFIAYSNDTCSQQPSNIFTLTNGVIVDAAVPTVLSINRLDPSPTNASDVSWSVVFSEAVANVDAADFSFATVGLTGTPIVTSVSAGPSTTYTVTASTANGTGTLGLNLDDNDSITDAAGNKLGGAGDNADFTGQTYSIDRTLTPSVTVSNKEYDGTTSANIDTRSFTSALTVADALTVTGGTATFDDKSVGNSKTVTVTGLTLTGTNAARYVLSSTSATTTANITAKALTIVGAVANDKEYDGTAEATINFSGATLSGVIGGDTVTIDHSSYSASFADKTVANDKPVTVSGVALAGADAGNYTVSQPSNLTANITAKALTIVGAVANDKEYDGNASATVDFSGSTLSGVLTGNTVTIDHSSYSASFANKAVGAGKAVTVTGVVLAGADAVNYSLSQPTGLTANITAKALTITGAVANDKEYNGTADATVDFTSATLSGTVGSDDVSIDHSVYTASFANKAVGTGKAVTVTGVVLAGADAVNYSLSLSQPTGLTANITAKALTIVGAVANDKEYDGTADATVNFSGATLSGIIGGDAVTIDHSSYSASFADKTVDTDKPVTVTNVALAGADAANYTISQPGGLTADITPKNLTVLGAVANDKEYDGTASATVNFSGATLSGVIGGDTVTIDHSAYVASFADKTVGNGKAVTVTGVALVGADAVNYNLLRPSDLTANITAKNLTISGAVAQNKVYDGTASATVDFSSAALSGIVGTDAVTLDHSSYVASFANSAVGTGKAVSVTGVALAGADAGNYTVSQPSGLTADITSKNLTISGAVAQNKVYDGTTSATVDFSGATLPGVLGGDTVTIDHSVYVASFADKTVGNGKAVTVTGVSLAGADAGNYTLSQPSGLTANITVLHLTGTFTADNKVYDGTTTATVLTRNLAGVVSGDTVSQIGGAANFDNKNVGNGKTVTLTGATLTGGDAANYFLDSVAATTANISQKSLTVTGITANDKVFDTTTAATVNVSGATLVGVVSGDTVTLNTSAATGTFASASVGTHQVQISGLTLSGADAGNYSLVQPTTTATIGPWTLSGFYQPVSMGPWVLNTVKGGSTVPLKFNIYQGTTERTDVAAVHAFFVNPVQCTEGPVQDPIELTTSGGTTLRYDTTGHQFIQNWQTPKTPGACYRVTMEAQDGNKLEAFFKMK